MLYCSLLCTALFTRILWINLRLLAMLSKQQFTDLETMWPLLATFYCFWERTRTIVIHLCRPSKLSNLQVRRSGVDLIWIDTRLVCALTNWRTNSFVSNCVLLAVGWSKFLIKSQTPKRTNTRKRLGFVHNVCCMKRKVFTLPHNLFMANQAIKYFSVSS